MKLTPEQKRAVRCDENAMITACPGSGKTRVVISKLLRSIDSVRDTPRAVACITYTNAAVHEIEARLQRYVQPGDEIFYDVGTIHSFCLNHVFRPFCYRIKGFNKGFKILTPESEEFEQIVKAVCEKFGRLNLTFNDFDEFTQLRINIQGEPIGIAIEQGSITPDMANLYWKRIRESGLIDFANIIYYSFLLLQKSPDILDYVASKFAWLLVDEFQDTSDLQVEILSLIAGCGRTRFFLVGDPYQSIFGFAGARPDLAGTFATSIGARTDLTLSGNFRSSPAILKHAELLLPRNPTMKALGKARHFTETPVWQHGSSAFNVITDYFLPALEELEIKHGDTAILAPTWFALFPLGRKLRDYGVNIVGPGACPYRRNRHFAPLAEKVCGYLMEPDTESIRGIERTLFNTLLHITGRTYFKIFTYRGRVVIFRLLEEARRLSAESIGAVTWLDTAAMVFSRILIEEEYLSIVEQDLFAMSVEEMKADMLKNKVDIRNLTVSDLGVYARPTAALKLSTLHNAKGREYDAVAMIDLHDGKIPSYHARTYEDIEEQKRLFYVGLTRAKRYLLYVTDQSGRRNEPSRFLTNFHMNKAPQ